MGALIQARSRKSARRRPIQTFDPAEHAQRFEYPEPLTDDMLKEVLSRPGWHRRYAGTYETNPDLNPLKARGSWPNPGLYEAMPRRDPTVASELERGLNYLASLDWRVTAPPDATPEEVYITDFVRDTLWSLPGGFSGLIKRIGRRRQYGFALLEMVFELEESTLLWRLEDCVFIHPCTVYRWITDDSGHLVGILQNAEGGIVPIPVEKLAHFARGFTGRNWEGESALRSCFYYVAAKGEALNNYAASAQIFGEGWIKVKTATAAGSPERAELELQLEQWSTAEQRWLIIDELTEVTAEHGGSVLPDIEPVIRMYNQQISRALDGGLQELGTSEFGARAVGSEMRQATHQSLTGESYELASLITAQIVQPLVNLNGGDVTRTPTITVRGVGAQAAADERRAARLYEMLRDNANAPEPIWSPEQLEKLKARYLELNDIDP